MTSLDSLHLCEIHTAVTKAFMDSHNAIAWYKCVTARTKVE